MTKLDQSLRLYIGDTVVNMLAAQAQRDDAFDQLGRNATEIEKLKQQLANTTEGIAIEEVPLKKEA